MLTEQQKNELREDIDYILSNSEPEEMDDFIECVVQDRITCKVDSCLTFEIEQEAIDFLTNEIIK